MATGFVSGKIGYVQVAASFYKFDKWKVGFKTALVEVTNFTSPEEGAGGCKQEMIAGITSATITISGPFHPSTMLFVSGQSYTWVLGFTSLTAWTIDALIESMEVDADVKTRGSVSITAQSDGDFEASLAGD